MCESLPGSLAHLSSATVPPSLKQTSCTGQGLDVETIADESSA